MNGSAEARVAVYIDFDNIVISRYDQVHRRGAFQKDGARSVTTGAKPADDLGKRVEEATVDLGAVLDYASSFGTVAISRAYADWSAPINANYRKQLVERAVDLVQLFPVVASMKNGADIRLAVDVIEDLMRLPDLTHVVIVAGDSDYISLAQRAKVLGRYVIGIGVAGATSRALASACNEFASYDALPGVEPLPAASPAPTTDSEPSKRAPKTRKERSAQDAAGDLLERAIRLGVAKNDEEWQGSGAVKNQMLRMDPTFEERALGFSSFSGFVKSQSARVELDESSSSRMMRLRPDTKA
ncbi:NYN domain-containing protein [Agromyces atrinae]|uniref:NYN domain-containing protein n=1 Tax=Agromyces atrinae TaxID=592376 RepID=A0A4Q2M857_9MICO|nr:NYN domain-containing protein [Agromyces atrinae]MCI2957063.1 NYN domain-containing protein [Agromyces atrinae]NYD67581.1 hypothetical protein [Agromyces atrinae]RXZ88208.1 NYN domain-containing protein [Agromyces atrinae]